MSKAEKMALKAYPENIKELWGPLPGADRPSIVDDNLPYRKGYTEGYKQAEKDIIEKARNWLLTHTFMFDTVEQIDLFLELFTKAMQKNESD